MISLIVGLSKLFETEEIKFPKEMSKKAAGFLEVAIRGGEPVRVYDSLIYDTLTSQDTYLPYHYQNNI